MGLIAASGSARRFRRSRVLTALLSAGWPAVAVGVLIGPAGVGAVTPELISNLTPVVFAGLGWIGLMIGMQLHLSVLDSLPRVVWRLGVLDLVVSASVFGALTFLAFTVWPDSLPGGLRSGMSALIAASIISACGVGWSMETRSLRHSDSPESARLALFVRAAGGLAAAFALAWLGVASKIAVRLHSEAEIGGAGSGLLLIVVAMVASVAVGLLGGVALRRAGKSRADLLAVFLGVVALSAGLAADLRFSPLLASMIVGAVLVNLAGEPLRSFQRFIMEAEHVVAVVFSLIAGAMLTTRIELAAVILAIGLVAARLITKPVIFRIGAGAAGGSEGGDGGVDVSALPSNSPLFAAPIRQSPVALAIAVSAVIVTPEAAPLLTIVVIVGVLSEALPLVMTVRRGAELKTGEADAGEASSS